MAAWRVFRSARRASRFCLSPTDGGFLSGRVRPAERRSWPLGLIEACGLLEHVFAVISLLVEFALLDIELLAEFGFASLESLSLAREVLRVAMVRVHLPRSSLQVRLPPIERGLPIIERLLAGPGRFLFVAEGRLLRLQGLLFRSQGLPLDIEAALLGGNVLSLRLDPPLSFEEVVLAGLALVHAGLQVLLDLVQTGGALGQVLLPAGQHGPLGIPGRRRRSGPVSRISGAPAGTIAPPHRVPADGHPIRP